VSDRWMNNSIASCILPGSELAELRGLPKEGRVAESIEGPGDGGAREDERE
jgi:hypothetical protein